MNRIIIYQEGMLLLTNMVDDTPSKLCIIDYLLDSWGPIIWAWLAQSYYSSIYRVKDGGKNKQELWMKAV